MRVNLVDIVYGLESQSEGHLFYVNRHTGAVMHIVEKYLRIAKYGVETGHMQKWEEVELQAAKHLLTYRHDYILIPTMPPTYNIMIWFAETIVDSPLRAKMLRVIEEQDTFKPFRSLLKSYNLLEEWYGYREEVYIDVARKFCEEHGLNYKLSI